MVKAISFLPYGACVDHFQHWVYENPDVSPEERKSKWGELEKIYLPLRDYDDLDFPNRGGLWQGQLHIYQVPFYYIDYITMYHNIVSCHIIIIRFNIISYYYITSCNIVYHISS